MVCGGVLLLAASHSRFDMFYNLVCFCSFQVFGDEANLYNIEDVQSQDLGQFSEVVVTKDDTLLMKVRQVK